VPVPFQVQLQQYEGPLDLLLDLIRKQQIEISDIPIARITQQYLEYLEQAAALDIELSAEFVFMAATLIHIKSKMLLPKDPELEKILPDEEGDPRAELVERLLEHERYKNAAEMLQQKRMIEDAIWSNPQIGSFAAEEEDPGLPVTLHDLVKTFQEILERAKAKPTYDLDKEEVTVPEMIGLLRSLFRDKGRETISARELFERQRSRRGMICLFLAILEMVKRQSLELVQKESFGEIALRRAAEFDNALDSEAALAGIQEEYK
jgi:segregation and condensation protein A